MVIALVGLLLLFLIRARWLQWQIDAYAAKALWFLWRIKQPAELATDMSQIWPVGYIMTEMWRWDFRRYVVDVETYDTMQAFIAKELSRNDLSADIFNE